MIETFFLLEISRRCLFLYRIHVFRISVTGMSLCFFFFCFFFLITVCLTFWIRRRLWACCPHDCVDPQMIHFELFYHLVRRSQFNPQTIFVSLGSWKKEGRSSSNSGYKIQKICGWKICSGKYTYRILKSKDGTTSMKIVN